MNSSLRDQMLQWKKKNMPRPEPRRKLVKQKPPKKKPEVLSERDLLDLMGTNMKTLRRGRGGAYK